MSEPNINRAVVHFDLDAFYVNVECLRDARLRGRPIAVGGHSDRGVIVSCSYEARKFGVRSAMPTRAARKLCPELTIVRGDMESYSKYSGIVTEIIRSQTPLFEKSSIDEFYIEMTGMDRFFGIALYIGELRNQIIRESGLSISYALATNKLVSKIATNEVKPHGEIVVKGGQEKIYLSALAIEKMPMVGVQTASRLRHLGLDTIGALGEMTLENMTRLLGKNGTDLWRKAQGIDHSPVIPFHEQKSIGTENTFGSDTKDLSFLHKEISRMTEKIAFELRSGNKLTGCITIKIRYSDFKTFTMQSVISYTANDHVLLQKAKEIFMHLYDGHLPVRLIGVRFTSLITGTYQINLFEDSQQMIGLYQAIDSVKKKFGEKILHRAGGI